MSAQREVKFCVLTSLSAASFVGVGPLVPHTITPQFPVIPVILFLSTPLLITRDDILRRERPY